MEDERNCIHVKGQLYQTAKALRLNTNQFRALRFPCTSILMQERFVEHLQFFLPMKRTLTTVNTLKVSW